MVVRATRMMMSVSIVPLRAGSALSARLTHNRCGNLRCRTRALMAAKKMAGFRSDIFRCCCGDQALRDSVAVGASPRA